MEFQKRENFRLNTISMLEKVYGLGEVWAFHPSFLNILVSNTGKVKNALTGTEFSIRKTWQNYCTCSVPTFHTTGIKKSKSYLVHRLVAETFFTFLVNVKDYEVNHISGDKSDNSVYNLNWMTRQENLQHARDNGLFKPCFGSANGRFKHSESDLKDIVELKKLGYTYTEIAKSYNLKPKNISTLLKRRRILCQD